MVAIERLDFTLPGFGISLNTYYSGIHPMKRAKLAKQWHEAVWAALYDRYGTIPPTFTNPVVITVTSYRDRPFDCDNVAACAKLVGDGLVECRLLIDDSPKYVSEVRLRSCKGTKRVEVCVMDTVHQSIFDYLASKHIAQEYADGL